MTAPGQSDERLSEVRFLTVAEVAALMREHAVHEYLRGAFSQTA
jgi:hypothetical protein